MISIEELCGIKPYTEKDLLAERKRNSELNMQFFDALPQKIRNFLNYSDVPIESYVAARIFKTNEYRIKPTIEKLKGLIDDYKRRNFQ